MWRGALEMVQESCPNLYDELKVCSLIDENHLWKREDILNIFPVNLAQSILGTHISLVNREDISFGSFPPMVLTQSRRDTKA
ncbi:uncharacterized protein G2W53_040605 [Senna tora]|uniref:Uncharacterized protein n=1 Tax=Senna tora TaxID=362788 RepID=A0A834SQ44_9FABA|nr:uncharacterized protein G2W53_040605 [Senna tora]